jgi:leader peptidase (prepilin peptidase)/N-methyltransferase
LTVLLMALLGFIVGFGLDEAVARLAREPFERREADASPGDAHDEHHGLLDLGGEAGSVALPWSLTGGSLFRRLLVVAATTTLFAAAGSRYDGHPWAMLVAAGYIAVLITCASTDIIAYRVPNTISYPAIVAALLIGLFTPGTDRASMGGGALLAGGLFLGCAILPGAPMGMGDVKLALFIGLALGLLFVVHAMLIMALAGGAVATVLLFVKVLGRRNITYMFYAPFISIGAIAVMLLQGTVFFHI